ncbi:sugar ABC transporter substrate-binding protein [Mycolicibacterium smegmatis]|uniref:D-ribose transporter subunit RbsB n=1 Tax=Mycolicibacterium smegmatis (strain MKD8) TaxID=1214915 RepID=A0A2U9PI97_MYCSE|nr:substrate-binding domain-containing protein [Mycolicibacterium smegmatis]AWT51449.1 D-ribose transporter subunit RbsB [Mycolicibacterium smegmatis MKD8]
MINRSWRKLLATAVLVIVCLAALVSCALGGATSSEKEFVVFMPTTSDPYIAGVARGIREEAHRQGYVATIIENNFDQSQQDQQVRQYLIGSRHPAAVLWWPNNAKASINSLRQLARVAPVIQFNTPVDPSTAEYVTAYAGQSHFDVAFAAGQSALQGRRDALAEGATLHGRGGNLLEFTYPISYDGNIIRSDGFDQATASEPFNILRKEPAGFSPQEGYLAAAQVIPRFKAQGIDFVYTHSSLLAIGVIKALRENGLTPGKDVQVIAANIVGDLTDLRSGAMYSAVIQAPYIEGQIVVRSAVKYLDTMEVAPGAIHMPATPEDPGIGSGPPAEESYMPNPAVTFKTVDSIRVWGLDIDGLTN